MKNMADCTEAEMRAFVAAYPRKLECDVNGIHEPPIVAWHDFTRGADSIVAAYLAGDDPKKRRSHYGPAKGFQVLACAECGKPLPASIIAESSELCSPECVDDHYPESV